MRGLFRTEKLYYASNWFYHHGWTEMGHLISAVNKVLNCCVINCQAEIGKGLHVAHAIGLVIGGGIKIGSDCTIYHNTTIGNNAGFYPVLGNKVVVYPHTIIAGNILIPDNSIIPAKSTLFTKKPSVWEQKSKRLVERKD